jgi:outer membrane protein OmpA-like peptidoglycan-associated protein
MEFNMKGLKISIILIFQFAFQGFLLSQESYTVTKASFSSERYDEFSPVFFNNGIVFCSNRNSRRFINYLGPDDKGNFKLYFIDTISDIKWTKSRLFSKGLTTRLNDGPASFNKSVDTIYYSRNLRTKGKLSELSGWNNNLGIFSAVNLGKKWDKITEFRYNNELYNFTTPCLSPDGSILFFASDKPGGFGGSDIYYCKLINGNWDEPVNLGSQINTKGNESYPFINNAGELFFSSDGRDGHGGKDIYVTKQNTSGWYSPVLLDPPINSAFDDFGIVTDTLMNEGFFSSKRGKTYDIYKFSSNFFQFWFSEPQKNNQNCLTISDTGLIQIDTLRFYYLWDFGDGVKLKGKTVSHCFPENGKYTINLDVIDKLTNKLFFRKLSYDIEIFSIEQPFISAPVVSVKNERVEFYGSKSYFPGYVITGYFWDFGDGIKETGEKVNHIYSETGDYNIRMGLTLKSQKTGSIIKRVVSEKISILNNEAARTSNSAKTSVLNQNLTDIWKIDNMKINRFYSAENDITKESLFKVVLFSSRNRVPINSETFKKLTVKYTVKEVFEPETEQYIYLIDQQMTLMAAYPAYNDVITAGFKDAVVRLFVLKESFDKDLFNIKKNFNLKADANFDASSRMTTNAYILLDQIVSLMNKYPDKKLEVGVYTDNQGVPANLTALSQYRAQVLVNHLITRGININRLAARGYGNSRPISTNNTVTDRNMNRRIDFTFF